MGALLIILLIIFVLLCMGIRIVPQGYVFVVENLGKYHATLQAGFHVIIPFIQRVAKRVSLKEQVADFPPQGVITKDNVIMQIDTVVYFKVADPKLYAYGAERPILALENLTATTLRNLVGELELDQTLTSRDNINSKMRVILDEATDPWGIKVGRVELKNIIPPEEIQRSMEKQMRHFLRQRVTSRHLLLEQKVTSRHLYLRLRQKEMLPLLVQQDRLSLSALYMRLRQRVSRCSRKPTWTSEFFLLRSLRLLRRWETAELQKLWFQQTLLLQQLISHSRQRCLVLATIHL